MVGSGIPRVGDDPGRSEESRARRVGVIGTLVWDTIHHRDAGAGPTEEWGGIAYALEAFSANLPEGWEIIPIVKVGDDLAEPAHHLLEAIPGLEWGAGVRVVPEPNPKVELRYEGPGRRTERISGGVSPWLWPELGPLVEGLDALYLNFISGFELDLDCAQALRIGFSGPLYADLHSLFLGVGAGGARLPRELPDWTAWLRCFDAVQMNESEFELLAQGQGDPWVVASNLAGRDLQLVVVTMGPRGAAYVAGPGFDPSPDTWPRLRARLAAVGTGRSGLVEREGGPVAGDPTGCGDVWGATFFARLLAGDPLEEAMRGANRMAARNVEYRGAPGLRGHLTGGLSTERRNR